MMNLVKTMQAINIFQIILFAFGTYMLFKKNIHPKTRADIATYNVALLLLYCLGFLVLFALGFLKDEKIYYLSGFFVVAPFLIGKMVKFKTLKVYSLAQFAIFCLSLIYLLNLH